MSGTIAPKEEDYVEKLAKKQHAELQQMEASDRWAILEEITPAKDITALHHKMDLVSSKTMPHVFYDHEGQYQEERAGLYKTSYSPSILQHAMNKEEKTGARATDVSECHKNALDLPLELNEDMAHALQHNRTLGGPPASVPQLHDQPSHFETFGAYDKTQSLQKAALQPTVETTSVRTQEGGVVLKESTYGEGYNTKKFLQENNLPSHARNEPTSIMSHENTNLNNVYLIATPSQGVPGIRQPKIPFEKELPYLDQPGTAPELGTNAFADRYSYQACKYPVGVPIETRQVSFNQHSPKIPVNLTSEHERKLQQKHGVMLLISLLPSPPTSWETHSVTHQDPGLLIKTNFPAVTVQI